MPEHSCRVLFRGCGGCCNANEKVYIFILISTTTTKKTFHRFIHTSFQKLLSSDYWKRMFTQEWLSVSRNCLHSNCGFWAKSMRNTGHGGRPRAICPEIFFDILTGGYIFNP